MKLLDRILRLQRIPPFHRLDETELGAVARTMVERSYPPGGEVSSGEAPLPYLFVVVEGSILAGDTPLPAVFGETSLLFGALPVAPLRAGTSGARCLLVRRGHFFTLLNECPWILRGAASGTREEGP